MANAAAFFLDSVDVTGRNSEYTGNPYDDTAGDGSYNTYLGCNRAGSNAPGIGIATGAGARPDKDTDPAGWNWTLTDQHGAARDPQDSQQIGGAGFIDRSSVDWPSSGGREGIADTPINAWDVLDLNDDFSLPSLAVGWVQNENA